MEKKTATQIANELFKTYPKVDAFHVTTDGQAFEQLENANDHARSLDKKSPTVVTVKRGEKASDEFNEKVRTHLDKVSTANAGDAGAGNGDAGNGDAGNGDAVTGDAGNGDAGAAAPKAPKEPKAKGGKK